jgi:hypothetical protein
MMTDRKLFLWMTLAMLGWGVSWPIAKILSNYITEHELVTYRYALTVFNDVAYFVLAKIIIQNRVEKIYYWPLSSVCC